MMKINALEANTSILLAVNIARMIIFERVNTETLE